MEEITIRKLVDSKHKNVPFDSWKYKNALVIDKVEIENDWVEYYATL